MHALVHAKAPGPGLFHGEAENGREPGDDAAENLVGDSTRGPAARAGGGIAIQRVLADVEIKGRQVVGAEIEQGGIHKPEVKILIGLADDPIHLGQAREHEAFQLRHLRKIDAFLLIEARQVGQHEADGVAQAAIGLDIGLDDVLADAQVFGEVRRRRPQAQDFRAVLLRDDLRRQRIAQALGHFAAILVQDEAMGQHTLVRRMAGGADAFQQRGLEPAAMLVGAFQIQVGAFGPGPAGVNRLLDDKDMS